MKKRLMTYLLLGVFGFTMMIGCKKKEDDDVTLEEETTEMAADNSLTDQTFSDAFSVSSDALQFKSGAYKTDETLLLTDCATLTWDNPSDSVRTTFPKLLTLTFNDPANPDGCLGKDGRYRKGKIRIKIENAKFRTPGSVTTLTFEDYYVNGNKVEGTQIIENKGANSAGNVVFKIELQKTKIKKNDGKTVSWESTRFWEIVNKPGSWMPSHFLLTGSGNGVNGRGRSYTVNIDKAIRFDVGCRWPTTGAYTVTPTGKDGYSVDLGNGACDRLANITYLGKSYQFEMR